MGTISEIEKALRLAGTNPFSYFLHVVLKEPAFRDYAVQALLNQPESERKVIRMSLAQVLEKLKKDATRLQDFYDQTADRPH